MKTVYVFAYGLLKPGHNAPSSAHQFEADAIKGDLYDLGDYPAAINITRSNNTIPGITMRVDEKELPLLDEFEDVAAGEYRRIEITTKRGKKAYVYEYALPLPTHAKRVAQWEKLQ